MRVVITKDQREGVDACRMYLKAKSWDPNQQALVFEDWEASVVRILSNRQNTVYLNFLVTNKLVPMTLDEFNAALKAHGMPER